MNNNNHKWIGHLAAIATYIIFGINPNCSKAVIPEFASPAVFTALRVTFAAIAFWVISLFCKKEKIEKRDMWLIFFGAVSLVGTLYAFAAAIRYISPTYVSIISAMSPLIVMLLAAIFLREPISSRKSLGVFFGILGAFLMIVFSIHYDMHYSNIGALLCLINILFYASYLLITRTISRKYSPVSLMKWMFLFCALISIPMAIPTIQDSPILLGNVPFSAYLNLSAVLIFATVIAYFLLPVALHHLRPTTVSVYSNLQPIVTSVVSIAVGQDIFTWNKPVALLFVIIGVFLVTTSRARIYE